MTYRDISENKSLRTDKANEMLQEFEYAIKQGFSIHIIDITQQHLNGSNYILKF